MGVAECFTTGTGLLDIVEAVRGATHAARAEAVGRAPARSSPATSRWLHDGQPIRAAPAPPRRPKRVIGVTGSPGAGKSTLVAQLVGEHAAGRERPGESGAAPSSRSTR
jgi:putative protein kinase ArgK-like GTPase of G3E family